MTSLRRRVRPKAKPDGSTVFVADYQDPVTGKRKQREAATEEAAWALIDLAHGRAPRPVSEASGAYSIGAAVKAFLRRFDGMEVHAQHRSATASALEYFGESTALEDVTLVRMEDYLRWLRLKKQNKDSTIAKKWDALKRVREYAAATKQVSGLDPMPPRPRFDDRKNRIFSDEERDAVLEALRERSETAADVLELMFETCGRFSDVNRIEARGVKLDMERPENSRLTFFQVKNKQPRTIPLTPRAVELLARHLRGKRGDELLFGLNYPTYKKQFVAAKARAGIVDSQLTQHCARHTAATRLAEANVNQGVLMAYGGWKTLQSVSRYMHVSEQGLLAARDALK